MVFQKLKGGQIRLSKEAKKLNGEEMDTKVLNRFGWIPVNTFQEEKTVRHRAQA